MKRLYVLTRSDLGLPYQAVQGAHAVAQYMLDNPNSEWKNGYLIFLSVEDEAQLDHWDWKIQTKRRDTRVSRFREPDINDELTAIAVYVDGRLFRKLPIMGSDYEQMTDEPNEKLEPPKFDLVQESYKGGR